MASPIENATEAVGQGFSGFDPQSPNDLIGFFDDLPHFFEELAASVSKLAGRDDLPLNAAVSDQMGELASALAGIRDQADDLRTTFRSAHEGDIDRTESPRPREEAWDVSNN